MTKLTLLVATTTLLATACGGGGGGNTNAITSGAAEPYCEQGCTYTFECDPTTADPVETCVAECLDQVVGVFREDVFIDVSNCATGLDCDASDDSCFLDCEPTASHQAYETACRDALAQCDVAADDIDESCEVTPSADIDAFFCALAPAIVDDLTECFGGTCQEQADCRLAVLEANGLIG